MRLIKTPIDMQGVDIDEEKIFLGTWCFKDDENVLRHYKEEAIANYHWDDRVKYNQDYFHLSGLYEKLLEQYAGTLNHLHNIDGDLKYWRIIIGPWLRFFVDSVFDRYEQVRLVKGGDHIPFSIIYSYSLKDWIPLDFADFYDRLTNDDWNEVLFSECLKYQKMPIILSETKILPDKLKYNTKKPIIKKIIRGYDYIISRGSINYVLVATQLRFTEVVKLYFSLGKMPYFLTPIQSKKVKVLTESKREDLHKLGSEFKSESNFESFIHMMIGKCMPKIYVEGFVAFRERALRELPKNTRVIYTVNAYQGDDTFKFWCAERMSSGARLIVGQHGGNFGVSLINQTEDHQLKIADDFLSWGWKRAGYFNVTPQASIKLSNNKIQQCDSGDILHVLACFPRYFHCHYSMPAAGQFLDYLEEQIDFIKQLDGETASKIKLRLDSSGDKYGNNVKGALINAGLNANIDMSEKSLLERLEGCRICVCTHNATVFLETLSNNFPTIIFWDENIFELRSDAKEKFKILEDAKILHYSHVSAATTLSEISKNVSAWWLSKEVQAARKIFVDEYARHSYDAFEKLSYFLNKQNNILSHQN